MLEIDFYLQKGSSLRDAILQHSVIVKCCSRVFACSVQSDRKSIRAFSAIQPWPHRVECDDKTSWDLSPPEAAAATRVRRLSSASSVQIVCKPIAEYCTREGVGQEVHHPRHFNQHGTVLQLHKREVNY